jgi:diguanylate cyclase (GGDEF)-like protein
MDYLTASISLIVVQLCIAAVMLGAYSAAPTEKCLRYWALAGLLVGLGAVLVLLNAGAPRYAILVLGNNMLIFGLIVMWWGIQVFFKKQPGKAGWYLLGVYFVLFGALLIAGAPIGARASLSSAAIVVLQSLCFREVWHGRRANATVGNTIALAALAMLIACYLGRMIGIALQSPGFLINNGSALGATVVFFIPMAGSLLLFSGLLLLHFEEMVRQKHHLATHDELTGILNRRAIDASGRRAVEMASRLKHSLCVAVIDIDFFKQINDRFGHQAGDEAIRDLAHALQKMCRNIDLIGRYGGEEFCAIFPMLSPDGAGVIAERIVATMRSHDFGDAGRLTVSVGLAAWSQVNEACSWEQLVACADTELYKAKNAGRDRFSISFVADKPETGAAAA